MRTLASYREALWVAASSLSSSKLRSFLTLLGIILATTTLIVVMSMVHGMDVYVATQVSDMGTDGFRVHRIPLLGEFDPKKYIDRIPVDRVVQTHLAGHTNKGTHILDTHSDYVIDTVWELYRYTHRRLGGVATLLEWDANIPGFEVVHGEALKARQFREQEDNQKPAPDLEEVPAYGD